jgi:hypothetical protein
MWVDVPVGARRIRLHKEDAGAVQQSYSEWNIKGTQMWRPRSTPKTPTNHFATINLFLRDSRYPNQYRPITALLCFTSPGPVSILVGQCTERILAPPVPDQI